jgi:hypothetical protein
MGKRRCARPERRAFQQRTRAVTNAAFGKETNDSPVLQPLNGAADGRTNRTDDSAS